MVESEAPITRPRSWDSPSTQDLLSPPSLSQGHKNVIHGNGSAFLHWVAIAVVNGLVRIPVEEADLLSGWHCPRDIKTQFSFSSIFFNLIQCEPNQSQGTRKEGPSS
ncbi:hypothetical protein GBA52_004721 [Prunus armeniaca]|nr:hypothetical protein GBA52_004721 [Prunus armeniaca]